MVTATQITPRQLELARKLFWHQDGGALRTTDSIREWLEGAGLVPVYPLAQLNAPSPSFAEAALGRPENGWIPNAPSRTDEQFLALELEGRESQASRDLGDGDEDFEDEDALNEEILGDEDFARDREDEESELQEGADLDDENEPATSAGDEAMLAGDGNVPLDRETMLSDDDEIAEDEGDEIAEQDRIDSEGEPNANDLNSVLAPVNGFSAEEREVVHRALARLVEEGSAIPLNLLGTATGEPDYLVSASAFPWVFTLRGDKNWRQEPATTGALRVSPLAVKVFATLKEKGAMAPHQLTTALGQGLTDSATLRALTELWAIQRVIPLPDAEGRPPRWELTSARFLRAMKTGANAGQPTALSALISLYLQQAIAASTEEVEVFLSPLTSRSRVREVVHGLAAARQLESIVIEGREMLHLAGQLPELPQDDAVSIAPVLQRSRYEADDRRAESERRRHEEKERPVRAAGGFKPRERDEERRPFTREAVRGGRPPFQREGGAGERRGFGARPSSGPREGRSRFSDGAARPFQPRRADGRTSGSRPFAEGGDRGKSSFTRPWDEERGQSRNSGPREDTGFQRPSRPGSYGRRSVPSSDDGPSSRFTRSAASEGRGSTRRDGAFTRGERGEASRKSFNRPYTPRGDSGGQAGRESSEQRGGGFPSRQGSFTRRDGSSSERPYTPRRDRDERGGADRTSGQDQHRPFQQPQNSRGRSSFNDRGGYAAGRSSSFGDRRPLAARDRDPRVNTSEFPRGRSDDRRSDAARPPRDFQGGGRPAFRDRGFNGDNHGNYKQPGDRDRTRSSGGGRDNRDRFSGEPGEGRPSFQSGAHSAGPQGTKFGGSGVGRDRGSKAAHGGFDRPGFKPSRKGPGSGPGRGGAPKRRND